MKIQTWVLQKDSSFVVNFVCFGFKKWEFNPGVVPKAGNFDVRNLERAVTLDFDDSLVRGTRLYLCFGNLKCFLNRNLGDSNFLEDKSTKIFARKVADHYSARTNQTLEEREASPIIHLKKLNNWV